jgi:hypothetical protein
MLYEPADVGCLCARQFVSITAPIDEFSWSLNEVALLARSAQSLVMSLQSFKENLR